MNINLGEQWNKNVLGFVDKPNDPLSGWIIHFDKLWVRILTDDEQIWSFDIKDFLKFYTYSKAPEYMQLQVVLIKNKYYARDVRSGGTLQEVLPVYNMDEV